MPTPKLSKELAEQALEAVKTHGSVSAAARALRIDEGTLRGRLRTAMRYEAERANDLIRHGLSPDHDMTRMVPDGFIVKGVSSYYNKDGELAGQWVKSREDAERMAQLREGAIKAMGERIPRAKPIPVPRAVIEALANCYVITDYHIGMLSWSEETGEDWDVRIAEDLLVGWFAAAIKAAPAAATGILAQLGDLLHWDGLDAVTPTSRHLLDADTRFQKVVRITIRALRRIVAMLLEKHARVHIIMAEGNHDPASSIWLREWLHALYENEPRVHVDLSPDPFYCYEHGATSLFFHHGHKRKVGNIDDVFAAKFREVFGRTRHSYAHMGHMHHIETKESNLMIIEQHRTLAAKDAYASRGGWMAGRDAKVITYHKEYGEVGRVVVSPDMVKPDEGARQQRAS